MLAIKWAREQKVPYLGICLGFQLAVVEWTRHVLGHSGNTLIVLLPSVTDLNRSDVGRIRRKCQGTCYCLHARNIQDPHGWDYATGPATYCFRIWE